MAKPPLELALKLRDDVHKATAVRPRWVMVHELGLRHPNKSLAVLQAAVSLAIAKGWMIGEGMPIHSVILTDAGRQLGSKLNVTVRRPPAAPSLPQPTQ